MNSENETPLDDEKHIEAEPQAAEAGFSGEQGEEELLIWYFPLRGRKPEGPFSLEAFHERIAAGEVTPVDLVWAQGMDEWIRAHDAEGLFPEQPELIMPRRPPRLPAWAEPGLAGALRRLFLPQLPLGLLSAAVAVAIAWWWIPVNYTARAWLRISQRRPEILFATGREDQFLNHRRAQATLITSNIVLNPALRQPGVAQLPYFRDEPDPVTWLKDNVSVTFPGNSEIMQIGMTGDDPVQLRDLVKAVRVTYMDEIVAQAPNETDVSLR